MPKYTITIADIDLYINTEEAPEMVEQLVSTVDRRMRGILSMSPRLSKSEAAILCAIDYCAAKLKSEAQVLRDEDELRRLSGELEALKAEYAALAADAEEIRRENRVMNDLISKNLSAAAARPAVTAGEQLAIETVEQTAPAATEVMFDSEHTEEPAEQIPVAEEAPLEEAPKKARRTTRAKTNTATKNKVGDMFDMLTFKNV